MMESIALTKEELKILGGNIAAATKVMNRVGMEFLEVHIKDQVKYYHFINAGNNMLDEIILKTDNQDNIIKGYKVLLEEYEILESILKDNISC